MKELKVRNLNIKFSDQLTKTQAEEAIERGFAGVDLANGDPVYVVKVWVGDMRADQVHRVVKQLREDFLAQGIKNCMFVPLLKNGIQDIEVIEVPNEKA
jgi:hypothetical protein